MIHFCDPFSHRILEVPSIETPQTEGNQDNDLDILGNKLATTTVKGIHKMMPYVHISKNKRTIYTLVANFATPKEPIETQEVAT